MTGQEKAAVLLSHLGRPVLEAVLRHLRPDMAARLRGQLDQLSRTPPKPEQLEELLRELDAAVQAGEAARFNPPPPEPPPRPEPLRALPEPDDEAPEEDLSQIKDPLKALNRLAPDRLALALEGENARTVSVVLNFLEVERAGAVFKQLRPEVRREVSVQMGTKGIPPVELARRIAEAVLHRYRGLRKGPQSSKADARFRKMAEILRLLDKEERMDVLAAVEERDTAAAAAVKEHLYVIEDLLAMDNRSVQKVLGEIDGKSLAVALKGVAEEIQAKILANLSQRAKQSLTDEMELLGPVPPSQIQQAQKAIVETIQRLDQAGDLVLMR